VGLLLDLVNALACIGTAVALYPVLRRQQEAVALGVVTSRMFEAAIILIGVVSLLAVVTLRRDLAGAPGTDPASLVTAGRALVAVRDWTFLLGPSLMPGINALLLGWLLYRSGLVPRVIPVLGLIGAPLLIASATWHCSAATTRSRCWRRSRPPRSCVGAVAWHLAGRQGLQALPHHHKHGRAGGSGQRRRWAGAAPRHIRLQR
jgi:hypothetical protein